MAKIAFWITAGPELRDKALANIVLAGRIKTNRQQDVEVYFFGPGVKLVGNADEALTQSLQALNDGNVPMAACPFNAEQYGVTESVGRHGVSMEPAGEALVRLVEQGYQSIGV